MADVLKLLLVLGTIGGVGVMTYGGVALITAWLKRMDRRDGNPELQGEIEELRARVSDLEHGQERLAEMEERLDFAERLLAQRRERANLPGGSSE